MLLLVAFRCWFLSIVDYGLSGLVERFPYSLVLGKGRSRLAITRTPPSFVRYRSFQRSPSVLSLTSNSPTLSAPSQIFSDLFSTRKPRDATAGISSGLKSVVKGTVAGAISLVAQPIAGAQESGASGFFKGLGAGLITAVALPVTGVAVGGYQVIRGIGNTFERVREEKEGKWWDGEERVWRVFSLKGERGELEDLQKVKD